jgi:tyrosine-protein phosphatase YwqE
MGLFDFLQKKTSFQSGGLLADSRDFHTHILYGVDDGVKTIEEALHILKRYESIGIKELWLTPHIMEDYPNTAAGLGERFAQLCDCYKGPITLRLAAEYMLDNHFGNILGRNEELLPIGNKGNHLLVETSYYTAPMMLHNIFEQIKSRGYHPLFAHAERYLYMEKKHYAALYESGVKFQLNIPSLAGVYGPVTRDKATWLLKNNMYSAIGCDTHGERAIDVVEDLTLNSSLIEKLGNITKENI